MRSQARLRWSVLLQAPSFLPLPTDAGAGFVFLDRLVVVFAPASGHHQCWRRDRGEFYKPFQVLHGPEQQERIPGPARTARSEPGHGQIMFGLTEQPLGLFAITVRLVIGLGSYWGAGMITGILVDVPGYRARWRTRAAFVF